MNRVILSRKGFDSKYGGRPSPVFKNGSLFSLPIPQFSKSPTKYKALEFNGISGTQALREVASNKVAPEDYCHYDPALNQRIGLFGQAGSAQTELLNNGVSIGDMFLFFGWFRKSDKTKIDMHLIFGWLQIDEIISGDKNIKTFLKIENLNHPHNPDFKTYKNNTLYVGRNNFGLFKNISEDLILTASGYSKSMWELPKRYFKNSKDMKANVFLNRLKWFHNKHFLVNTNIGPGQEFILDSKKFPDVAAWAKKLTKRQNTSNE